MKRLHRGEKGFTLVELLIVVAILGILAAVVIPNVGGFFMTGKLNAANTEVANVRTAATGYYAENAAWPADSDALYTGDPDTDYLNELPYSKYTFDSYGLIATAAGGYATDGEGLDFVVADQEWVKEP